MRQVKGGSDRASHRFVILYEMEVARVAFAFEPTGVELTMGEVCEALIAHGISEQDATSLINDAETSFKQRCS